MTTPLVSSYFWPLRCLFFDVRLLSTHFVFLLLAIVLSVLRYTASDYPFGIFLLLVIVLSILRCKVSDYPFVIFLRLVIVLFVF